jgi:hypothetical protein
MSKRACASATCSLVVVTEKRQNSKPKYVCVPMYISLNVGITYHRENRDSMYIVLQGKPNNFVYLFGTV